jgi:5-methylcytosine-specific restriction protein A
MPMAPPRACAVCGRPACPDHGRRAWRARGRPAPERIRGRELQRLRLQLFRGQPWCVRCLTLGLYVLATIRDHVVPLGEGGTEDAGNVQGLCQACSDAKTKTEARRGSQRTR